MQKPMYTISDRVSRTFWTPFAAHNDDDAKRAISNAVNTPSDNDIFLHPEDFDLYKIGIFDDSVENGNIFTPFQPIEFIAKLDSLIHRTPSQDNEA